MSVLLGALAWRRRAEAREGGVRIRSRFFVLVLSVLLPAILAAALSVWYVYREERQAQQHSMAEAARAFALAVNNELQSREGILRTLATSPLLEADSLADFYAHAKKMAPTADTAIILHTPDGRQLLNTRQPLGSALPTRRSSGVAELIGRYGPDRVLVSDLFKAPINRSYDFTIQVPVRQNGAIRYFLVMAIDTANFERLLFRQHVPQDWTVSILDRKGVLVARSRDGARHVGTLVSNGLRQALTNASDGLASGVNLDGIPVEVFFSRVPMSSWTVLLNIPDDSIRRIPLRAAAWLAGIMSVILACAVLAANGVARSAIRPIEQLGDTAARLGKGEEIRHAPLGIVEIDAVGATMANASTQIHRARQELEQRVAEAVEATTQAQRALQQSQKLEALGRLTGGIAHEFNNVLQTLTTALQLAKMLSNGERVQSLLDTCNKAVARAAALTGQLSAFGRVQDAHLVTVPVAERIEGFLDLIRNVLPSNIAFDAQLPPTLWPATLDPIQLELALLNIAINARDAMPQGGRLLLEAVNESLHPGPQDLPAGDYVRIRMTDTGVGMSAEVLARALDPFYTTKAVGKGSGLGLPQAYGFARQSGGTMRLESSEGRGTTVEMYLPRALETPAGNGDALESAASRVASRGSVLFVEDDALVRDTVAAALGAAGFTVTTAATADEGLALLEAGALPDAVFSDITMPGRIGGIELAETVRSRFPGVAVVLASGYTDQRVAIPEVVLLPKPYRIDGAVEALIGAMGRREKELGNNTPG
ncbi:ATP-binding protein [Noviherbaspirillum pedocola]|uniref:histidine kinase n=1 Tax=Noviherbaspirillum pedocola TaxID=2801341 RepID=A0A934SWK0_9BURK|nr:ATP-binding protein [Noviherbaspirillum pedocola]MBK4736685.1 response regulator [Noviherbaspirillum pedocola]